MLYGRYPHRLDHMAFMSNVIGGFSVAFGVLGVLAIANGLSTYIFDGSSIQEKVNSRVGGGGTA